MSVQKKDSDSEEDQSLHENSRRARGRASDFDDEKREGKCKSNKQNKPEIRQRFHQVSIFLVFCNTSVSLF